MRLVHRNTAEPALKQMASDTLARVDVAAVAAVGRPDRTGKPGVVRRNEDDMKRVRHQAVEPHLDAVIPPAQPLAAWHDLVQGRQVERPKQR